MKDMPALLIKLATMAQQDSLLLTAVIVLSLALVLSLFLFWQHLRLNKALTAEQRQLREAVLTAEESSRAKTALLANISHEIRTPMHGIIGFSELALESNISLTTKDNYLRKILSNAEGLLQTTDDIIDILKIESGRIELENMPFDLHTVFRACQTIIRPTALEKGISLYCYTEPSVGKKLLGDPDRLKQALLHLLANAVKFTNTGMVKLLSQIVGSTDDTVTIRFEVKDSGVGMTPEQVRKIFDPFAQTNTAAGRKDGGAALGLAITKNIIELMGGRLEVKSEPGIGSRFAFELTFKTLYKPADLPMEEIVINNYQKPTFEGEILLCEDNEINQQIVQVNLERVGIKTTIAGNGKDGVELVRQRIKRGEKPFDLILMDIHMPVMDGLEAAQTLTKLGNQTPIVALTANVMENNRTIYKDNFMQDYLPKPFKSHELWALLVKYLTPVSVKAMELELNEAPGESAYLQNELPQRPEPHKLNANCLNLKKTAELFQRLEALLAANDCECMDLTRELRAIAGTGALIEQIEAYEFTRARKTLASIKQNLECES